MVFRLEELVEMLQDRRRRADQAAMLLIQQQEESKGTESQVRSTVLFNCDNLIRTYLLDFCASGVALEALDQKFSQ